MSVIESITLKVGVVKASTYRCFPCTLKSTEEQVFYIWCLTVHNHNAIMKWLNALDFILIK